MKTTTFITLLLATAAASQVGAAGLQVNVVDVDSFTDFSVSGMSESKTLSIFQAELEDEIEDLTSRFLTKGETLVIDISDIDMAGDIQPWRNRHNADIRYIEPVYPPRLVFTYVLTDADGKVLSEGSESISDLAYQTSSITGWRARSMSFYYEFELLKDWLLNLMLEVRSDRTGDR